MARLAVSLVLVAALLAALDLAVPRWLASEARGHDASGRVDTFANVVFRSFEQANRSVNAGVTRAHREFAALPDAKPEGEIRAFVIGNSAALFAIAPEALEERLSRAYPQRSVRLVPLLVPDAGVIDENLLVRAALSKQADLVLLTPNLKGLMLGREVRMRFLRDLFGGETGPDEAGEAESWRTRPGDALRRFLLRHWQTYRARDELRERLLDRLEAVLPGPDRAQERARIEAAFAEIERAARRRDVGALLDVYHRNGMDAFVPAGLPAGDVPRGAPVFRTMRRTAEEVRRAGAMGVAIFLPVNPLYRDRAATRDHPEVRVHDATLRRIARVSLELYQRAGFATADRLDALPPEAFIDLVHANASGMRQFTETAARVLIRALRAIERREGRSLAEDPADA
ncbi:MAG: hypothetical protein ACQGVC_10150 [Myxococcota bacterium]